MIVVFFLVLYAIENRVLNIQMSFSWIIFISFCRTFTGYKSLFKYWKIKDWFEGNVFDFQPKKKLKKIKKFLVRYVYNFDVHHNFLLQILIIGYFVTSQHYTIVFEYGSNCLLQKKKEKSKWQLFLLLLLLLYAIENIVLNIEICFRWISIQLKGYNMFSRYWF
jgi:hypothetical protein